MKLHTSVWYFCASSYDIASNFIHKKQNRCDKRRQASGQLRRALQRDCAGAFGVEHKADSVSTCRDCCVYILLAGQAADLDPGSVHGNQSKPTVRVGRPHFSS